MYPATFADEERTGLKLDNMMMIMPFILSAAGVSNTQYFGSKATKKYFFHCGKMGNIIILKAIWGYVRNSYWT